MFPPGTQRPCWPFVAVQTSCFKLVSATQQAPLGAGRLPFWAVAKAARPTTMLTRESCMVSERVGCEVSRRKERWDWYKLAARRYERNAINHLGLEVRV